MATLQQSYGATDLQAVTFKTADMMRDTGANAPAELVAKVQQQDALSTYQQNSRVVHDVLDTEYEAAMTYQRNTDLLAQMNESWNANRYLNNTVSNEAARLAKLDGMARREVYALRQRDLFAQYRANYYSMVSGVLVLSLFATLLLLLPAGLWRANRLGMTALVAIGGVVLLLFLTVLLFVVSRYGARDNTSWTTHRWGASKELTDKASAVTVA